MKIIYPLKPCPWCKKTPELYIYLGSKGKLEETFLPKIKCMNGACKVEPCTKYVPIRKTQRFNINIIREKVERVIEFWNGSLDGLAIEGALIEYDKWIEYILETRDTSLP